MKDEKIDDFEELLDEENLSSEASYSKKNEKPNMREKLNKTKKKTKEEKNAKLSEKRLIEAALFMSASPVSINRLMRLISISAPGYIKRKIEELKEEYDKNNSAIEIVEENNGFLMIVRREYVPYIKEFAKEAELSRQALRALGYISKHNGILKSDMVKRLGVWIYPAVRELIEKNFITTKRAGRSKKLYLSRKFKEYFRGE